MRASRELALRLFRWIAARSLLRVSGLLNGEQTGVAFWCNGYEMAHCHRALHCMKLAKKHWLALLCFIIVALYVSVKLAQYESQRRDTNVSQKPFSCLQTRNETGGPRKITGHEISTFLKCAVPESTMQWMISLRLDARKRD